jgi:predicted kinase
MSKELILLRGVPGSGKSTLAKSLGGKHFEADMYFMVDGKYKFDPTKLRDAHEWCRSSVGGLMINGEPRLIVSNTFTQEWEMEAYYKLGEKYGYRVYSLIVENRHSGVNEHGVPEDKLQAMKDRFEIKL